MTSEAPRGGRRVSGTRPAALVVGGPESRSLLAGVRALAAGGWRVGVGTPARVRYASTRRAERWHAVLPPERGGDAFVQAVADAVRAGSYDVVFPAGDAEALLLARHAEQLGAALAAPPFPVLQRALDKRSLHEAAVRCGLDPPAEHEPVDDEVPEQLGLPVVVKARVHALDGRDGGGSRFEARLATDRVAAREAVRAVRRAGGGPLVQEHVEGRLAAVVVLVADDGTAVTSLQQEALAVCPHPMGASCRARTTEVDPALAQRTRDLLGELGWTGLAELQLLHTPDGRYRLIDLNGRLYGSLPLALAAGVNLPDLWGRQVLGLPRPPVAPARVGVRYSWLGGELRRARTLRSPAEAWAAVRWRPGAVPSVGSLRDPMPALSSTVASGRSAARRLRGAGA